jgi:hypothetical protein
VRTSNNSRGTQHFNSAVVDLQRVVESDLVLAKAQRLALRSLLANLLRKPNQFSGFVFSV